MIRLILMILSLVVWPAIISTAHSLAWTTPSQLTFDGEGKYALMVGDGGIAWSRGVGSGEYEVYYYDGTNINVLSTAGDGASAEPKDIDGDGLVWIGATNRVFLHRNGVTTELTVPGYDARAPRISGNNVAWWGYDATHDDPDLFVYDGTSIAQVTNDHNADYECDISGSTVAWRRWDGAGYEIFTQEIGGAMQNLSDSSLWVSKPRIDGDTIAWVGENRSTGRYNVLSYIGDIRQLTNLSYTDPYLQPEVSGSKVVYDVKVGGIPQIFLYDGLTDTTTQLTNNSAGAATGYDPKIYGDYVAYADWDGHDYEIYLHDGTTRWQITDNEIADGTVDISGSTLAWISTMDQFGNNEIYTTTISTGPPAIPEPTSFMLLGLAILTTGMSWRRRRRGTRGMR